MSQGANRDYGELGPVAYLQTLCSETSRTWNRFWFTPRDPVVLGLLRVLSGLMLIYTHAIWTLRLDEFFGTQPWIDFTRLEVEFTGSWATFWPYVPAGWVAPVHYTCLAVLALYTLGCWTRITSILALMITVSYANRLFVATFGLDQFNAMLVFYMCIAPSARCLLDRSLATGQIVRGGPLDRTGEHRREHRHPVDPVPHVRDLHVRRSRQARRSVVVGRLRHVAGLRQLRISDTRPHLARPLRLRVELHHPCNHRLGGLLLRADLVPAHASPRDRHGDYHPTWGLGSASACGRSA